MKNCLQIIKQGPFELNTLKKEFSNELGAYNNELSQVKFELAANKVQAQVEIDKLKEEHRNQTKLLTDKQDKQTKEQKKQNSYKRRHQTIGSKV